MTLIGDGSMELQSINENNNITQSSINSASSAEQPSFIPKEESVIANDSPSNVANNETSPDAGSVNNGRLAKMAASKTTLICLSVFAVILIGGSVALGLMWMTVYDNVLLKQLILSPTSTSYGIWKEIPIPMYLSLYLYNWTNPDQFKINATEKPNFVQMGPYVFKENHVKVNQIWNENGTITYQQRRIWHFEESMSNGSLDDEITNINVIASTVGHFIQDESWAIRLIINGFLIHYNQTLVVTKTARELLFEGYEDSFLNFAKQLNISGINIPFDKFGWFYGRNGSDTYDGVFEMYTGATNIANLGQLDKWNYQNHTTYWEGECGVIRGSPGELWSPSIDSENVEIFAPDICTSLTLIRSNDSSILGVTGHTFVADSGTFDNGTNVPARACYCNETCQPSGILGVSKCKYGAPAYVSLPYFHLADESYRDAVTGLDPSNDDQNFALTLEPNTGIPLSVRAQLQLNILVKPIGQLDIFTGIPENYIPVLWFVQEVNLTDDYAEKIKLLLMVPKLRTPIAIVIGVVGFVLAATAAYLCYKKRSKAADNQVLIGKEDNSEASTAEPVAS